MSSLLSQFVQQSLRLCRKEADHWSRTERKILRGVRITFDRWDDSLQLEDLGYTPVKQSLLRRLYLNEKSRDGAIDLWDHLTEGDKIGSVAFSTCNHVVKGGESLDEVLSKKAKYASVQGPCMIGVSLTSIPRQPVEVDVFYRSTEFFKKLPADLIFLREVLLKPFSVDAPSVTLHLANVTLHPMYFVTLIPHMDEPLFEMNRIRMADDRFHRYIVKKTSEYVCPERGDGIAKHSQSQRVKKHALKAIRGSKLRDLRDYVREFL